MLIDSLIEICKGADATGAGARLPTTSYCVDLGAATPGNAIDKELYLVIQVDAAFTRAAGALNVVFTAETYTSADFSSARTAIYTSASLAKATLVAGYQVCAIRLPPVTQRYLTVVATPDASADTGTFSAFLTTIPYQQPAKS